MTQVTHCSCIVFSSENPSPMPPKEDDHQEEKSKDIFRKPRSDEDDEGGAGQGGSGGGGSKDKSNESSTAAQGGLEESKLKEGQSSTSPGRSTALSTQKVSFRPLYFVVSPMRPR